MRRYWQKNRYVLKSLFEVAALDTEASNGEARRNAIGVILSLATHRTTFRRIAKEQGLVASLSMYGSSEDEDVEMKRAAIEGVLLLTPSM